MAHALASCLDHTLLRPDARAAEIDTLCDEALTHGFATVFVNGVHVARAAARLIDSPVRVGSVAGFPLGASLTRVKRQEAQLALANGAGEVDMVQNVGALVDGLDEHVRAEIALLASVCHDQGATLKVILECCLLDDEAKRRACRLAEEAGADFVKTSTGFSTGGATVEDVALLRAVVGDRLGVKASGGIRDASFARNLVDAGATRIGTSAAVAIAQEG